MRPSAGALFLVLMLLVPRAQALESITAEGIVDAPVAHVWNAWTTTDGLQSWLAPHADIVLRIGGLMRTNYSATGTLQDAGAIANRVLAFEPERMLSIQVASAPQDFPFRSKVGDMWTVLYLSPAAEGKTLLRIVGLGFGNDAESQRMKEFFDKGNAYTLTQLQQHFSKK
jgi:uncharacterized protein YndB with AHSA1/START domain